MAVALAIGFPILGEALEDRLVAAAAPPALALPLVVSAFWWISAPTVEGRTVLDHIAGFKQYLSITERERLDRMTPPADTPELFEKYLPYRDRARGREPLGGALCRRARGRRGPGPAGLCLVFGQRQPVEQPDRLCHSMGSSLASTISSASTAPGSSSGSGGGGSSGGGGGGGGGGGW